jgi:hypothetical protein
MLINIIFKILSQVEHSDYEVTILMLKTILPDLTVLVKVQSPKIIMTGLKSIPLTLSFEIDLWGQKHFVLLYLRMLQM